MENYTFLLSIAIVLFATRCFSEVSSKVHMPQVVGALIAGVILGPSVLGLVSETDFLQKSAEIGVIILMFTAGLDTDIKELKKNSIPMLVIASLGILLPFLGGFATYYYFFDVSMGNFTEVLKAVFMGVVLTATSVSITVEALREFGKLNTPAGSAILGAAVIDDIIGVIVLTLVTSLKDASVSIASVFIKIGLYLVLIVLMMVVFRWFRKYIEGVYERHPERISIFVFAMALAMAFVSEDIFGVADITGAYMLGLVLSTSKIRRDVARKMTVPSYLFFSPVFFASIGIKTELSGLTGSLIVFSVIILTVAILSKVVGCGLGAKLCGYTTYEAINIGVGMISRGEVALIVAQKGYNLGLLDSSLFSPIVLVVIVTTIITPIILKKTLQMKEA